MPEQNYPDLLRNTIRPATIAFLRSEFVGVKRSPAPRRGRYAVYEIEDVKLGEIITCGLADGMRVSGFATVLIRCSVFDVEGAPSELLESPCEFEVRFSRGRQPEIEKFVFGFPA